MGGRDGRSVETSVDWVRWLEAVYADADSEAWALAVREASAHIFPRARIALIAIEHDAHCVPTGALLMSVPSGFVTLEAVPRAQLPDLIRHYYYPSHLVTTHLEIDREMPAPLLDTAREMRSKSGFVDALGIVVHPARGTVGVLFASSDRTIEVSAYERRLLSRLGLHLEAAMRLRFVPGAVRAVLSPDGSILHREDESVETDELATKVRRIEHARTRAVRRNADAIDLWSALTAGHASIIERFDAGKRLYLVIDNQPARYPMRALTDREVNVIAMAARAQSSKEIAYGLGISAPRVSNALATAAAKVGLARRHDLVRLAAILTRDPRARFEDITLTRAEREILEFARARAQQPRDCGASRTLGADRRASGCRAPQEDRRLRAARAHHDDLKGDRSTRSERELSDGTLLRLRREVEAVAR